MIALALLAVFLGGVGVGIAVAVENRRLEDWFDDWEPAHVPLEEFKDLETAGRSQ